MASNTYEAIATVTVGSGGAANIEFTSIPQTYTDLQLVCSVRIVNPNGVVTSLKIQCNGVDITGRRLGAEGNPMAAYSDTNSSAYGVADQATASTFGNAYFYIPNYTSSTTYKSISADNVAENNAISAGLSIISGIYSANTAISSLKILNVSYNLMQYSTATLYGIKNS
jgi:hypothetical protein